MPQDGGPTRAQAIGAVEEFRRRLRANPRDANTYRALARALRFLGANAEASEAELGAIDASRNDPSIRQAAIALQANEVTEAEGILRAIVRQRPDDVLAMVMLADVAVRAGFADNAEQVARHALGHAPDYEYARYILAAALDMRGLAAEALRELEAIIGPLKDEQQIIALKASLLGKLGDDKRAVTLLNELSNRGTLAPGMWLNIGDQLRSSGSEADAVAAYRRELAFSPQSGAAWWSLANIKTFTFGDDDLSAMKAALADTSVTERERAQLHFALGKALEDRMQDEKAFEHYRQANAIIAASRPYDPFANTRMIERAEKVFSAEFFEHHRDVGSRARDPIFIVGLTRSGSTLIEQILASHSMVEGTGELPDLIVLARELDGPRAEGAGTWRHYPALLADLHADDFRQLGEAYLERTRVQRKTDRPFFTDKMPNNWFHAGLIQLILPNARIIDARRHPLACGFSNFRQFYAEGQPFTYDLEHFGTHYRDYVGFMDHLDRVAPHPIHRVVHERLVTNPESEIRRLLNYLALPFEDSCLRFYETKRSVRSVSAEQVRQSLDPARTEHWKRFEQWLGPLKKGLGAALESWDR